MCGIILADSSMLSPVVSTSLFAQEGENDSTPVAPAKKEDGSVEAPRSTGAPPSTDPPKSTEADEIEARLRSQLEGPEPAQWYQALAELGVQIPLQKELRWERLLQDLITPPESLQNVERTRLLLAHRIFSSAEGERLILDRMRENSGDFAVELRHALRQRILQGPIAATADDSEVARVQGLLDGVWAAWQKGASTEPHELLFCEVFPIAAGCQPQVAIRWGVARLTEVGDDSAKRVIDRQLTSFLALDTPPESWQTWLNQKGATLLPDLLERRTRRRWTQVAELLANEPRLLRDFLLRSLLDTAPVSEQRLALEELQRFIQKLKRNGPDKAAKTELLRPVVTRLVEIFSPGTVVAVGADRLAPPWPIELRLAAMRRLAELADHVTELQFEGWLEQRIAGVANYPAGCSEANLGLEAVRLAGALGLKGVVDELDDAVSIILTNWMPSLDELMLALLSALRSVGPTDRSIDLVEQIYSADRAQRNPRFRIRALNAIDSGQFDEQARVKVFQLLRTIVQDPAAGDARVRAITCLGNLATRAGNDVDGSGGANLGSEAVAVLGDLVTSAAVTDEERRKAVGAVALIGGPYATRQLKQLREKLTGDLQETVAKDLTRLCSLDESLTCLHSYVGDEVLPSELQSFWQNERFGRLLNPAENTAIRAQPKVRDRWYQIRQAQCVALEKNAESVVELESVVASYGEIATIAESVMGVIDSLTDGAASEQAQRRAEFQSHAHRARARLSLAEAARKDDVAAVMKQLRDLSGNAEGGAPSDEFLEATHWLVQKLSRTTPTQGEAELTNNLRELLQELAQSDEIKPRIKATLDLIDALDQRRTETVPRDQRTSSG